MYAQSVRGDEMIGYGQVNSYGLWGRLIPVSTEIIAYL